MSKPDLDLTEFWKAVKEGDVETVQGFFGRKEVDTKTIHRSGFNALHFAVQAEKYEMVKFLLDQNMDINARTPDSDPQVIDEIKRQSKELERESHAGSLDSAKEKTLGETALQFSFSHFNPQIILLLVERDANLDRVNYDGGNALTLMAIFSPRNYDPEYCPKAANAILNKMNPEGVIESLKYLLSNNKKEALEFLLSIVEDRLDGIDKTRFSGEQKGKMSGIRKEFDAKDDWYSRDSKSVVAGGGLQSNSSQGTPAPAPARRNLLGVFASCLSYICCGKKTNNEVHMS